MNLFRRHVFVFVTALLLCACESSDRRAWDEETQLSGGRRIVVHQERRYERAYTGESVGDIAREAWLRFVVPEIQEGEISWHENLHPVLINLADGHLYVVGMPFTSKENLQYGDPNPPYVCFRYDEGKWVRILLKDLPQSIYDANMWLRYMPPKDRTFISLREKQSLLESPTFWPWQKRVDPSFRN